MTGVLLRHGRQRISTLLLAALTGIGMLVLIGLMVTTVRLASLRSDLEDLRSNALPRLVNLAQLSQEAAATSAIAPALSARPARSELETLVSRIRDKANSQHAIVEDLQQLFPNPEAAERLRRNGDLLIDNLGALTAAVRQQEELDRQLESRLEHLRGVLQSLSRADVGDSGGADRVAALMVLDILDALLDESRPRFLQKWRGVQQREAGLRRALDATAGPAADFADYWTAEGEAIRAEKTASLAKDFQIRAVVEENALLANRLLSTANTEFWNARTELQGQTRSVARIVRFTLLSILVVVVAFALGNYGIWRLLQRRVFTRLDRLRDGLRAYAEARTRPPADAVPDEIGQISSALEHYMTVIDEREAALAEKTAALEQLSSQLAKYLSPQVYDSIFAGRQEVKIASTRKKLTIFFSDIVGFTEAADRLESEELTRLLNEYLTEMSTIALAHGATIDKYVGDAILIFFGDPESRGPKEDAIACVKMAVAMRERMHLLEDRWRASGIDKPLRVRMGIHTGFCTVGNFGSEDRMDYTIVGGAVNVAARLEELAPPGEILISYETFALVRDGIACEERGPVEVKGVAYPVATYRVLDATELTGAHRSIRERGNHLRLDLDPAAMDRQERHRVADILRRALELVEAGPQPGHDNTRR